MKLPTYVLPVTGILVLAALAAYFIYTDPSLEAVPDIVLQTPISLETATNTPQDSLSNKAQSALWEKARTLSEALVPYRIEATYFSEPEKIQHPMYASGAGLYKVGTITNGSLVGETLYIEEQPGMGSSYYAPAIMREGLVLNLDRDKFLLKPEYNYPYEISIPGTQYKMRKGDADAFFFSSDLKATPVFSVAGVGNVSRYENSQCLVAELPDHTGLAYDLDIPFVEEQSGKLTIKLTNGMFFEDTYSFFDYGCGAGCRLLKYASPDFNPARLAVIGTDPNTGDSIYGIGSSEDIELKDLYNDKNTLAYFRPTDDWSHEPVSKYTYEEFIDFRPLLYWKDPWGKWVEFRNKRFDSAAEKCKPVIYLYPEKEGEYHVEVAPNGGFTKTIPEYGDGWDVRALPNGTLTDSATGLEYPYLYWSGIGLSYPAIMNGWVVAKEDVGTFLDEKLYALGLEGKEIEDFKEYWVPRLSEEARYKITFIAPRDFEKMAPLTVTPATPDTKIRVMMTAQAADANETLPELVLPPRPVRNGFVLVEWGGAVLY